jgi:hypothetical protein
VSHRGPCLVCLALLCLATDLCALNINATILSVPGVDAHQEFTLERGTYGAV